VNPSGIKNLPEAIIKLVNNIIMINIVIFGPPGSGKGTQAVKLVEKYGLLHLSTGELFRHEIGNKTPLGIAAKTYMDKGCLVPDEVTIEMLKNKVSQNLNVKGIIFDGFPRTITQAEALDEFLNSIGNPVSALIAIEVSDDEIIKRILHRGKDSGRSDDNDVSIIKNRIEVYNRETAPVFDFYDKAQKAHYILGNGQIEEIFKRICNVVDTLSQPVF
jgi:adenylate kinase